MTELSPLDVLGKTFGRSLRGYDADQVHEFLTHVAGAMEAMLRERGELRQAVHRLEQDLGAFRQREGALQDALVAAQQTAETTVERARSDGQRIVEDGQVLADRLLEEAHARAQNIETVIADLRTRRREARAELMRLVEVLQGFVRDDQELERKEPPTPQLAVLRRRNGTSGEG